MRPVVAGKCTVHAVDQVGTVPAALTTYLAVQEFKPDLIIRCAWAEDEQPSGAMSVAACYCACYLCALHRNCQGSVRFPGCCRNQRPMNICDKRMRCRVYALLCDARASHVARLLPVPRYMRPALWTLAAWVPRAASQPEAAPSAMCTSANQ